jgi:hypothetical protein
VGPHLTVSLTVEELHTQGRLAVELTDVVDLYDVAMVAPRRNARFVRKHLAKVGELDARLIAQDFERNHLAEAPVASDQREIDGGHPAFTQARKDSIASLHDFTGS